MMGIMNSSLNLEMYVTNLKIFCDNSTTISIHTNIHVEGYGCFFALHIEITYHFQFNNKPIGTFVAILKGLSTEDGQSDTHLWNYLAYIFFLLETHFHSHVDLKLNNWKNPISATTKYEGSENYFSLVFDNVR